MDFDRSLLSTSSCAKPKLVSRENAPSSTISGSRSELARSAMKISWSRAAGGLVILVATLICARPVTCPAAPAPDRGKAAENDQLRMQEGVGWEDWVAVREQHSGRVMVKVFVPKGQAPATAKVRLVVTQRPHPSLDSPRTIVDMMVRTAKQQCQKIEAKHLRSTASELVFELRGFGCAGQTGERYLLQRIAFIGPWEIDATYAPMTPTNDLPASQKRHAMNLLSSVSIASGTAPASETGWFLVTPPRMASGHFDVAAPLSKWKIEEGAGSRDKCQRLLIILRSLALKHGQPSDVEQVKDARCVPMEDPKLEPN